MIAPMTLTASALARLSRWAPASTSAATWSSAAATRSSSRASSARPAYVVAEDDLRARARAFVDALAARHRRLRRAVRLQGVPVHRRLPRARRGGPGLRRRLRRRAGAGAARPASTRARIYLHGNAKSEAELREALDAGVGHIVLDSLDEIDRLERDRRASRGARQEVLIRVTPGRRRRHPPRDLHRPGRLEVRLLARRRPARRSRALRRRTARSTSWACTSTSARSCSSSSRSAPRSGRSPRSATSPSTTSAAGSASPTPPTSSRPPRRASTSRRSSTPCTSELGPGQAAAARARPRAGGQLHRHALHGRRRSSATSRPGSPSTAACPTTCARCSTAPRYEAVIADRPLAAATERCHWPASTASPAT